jgi:exonuclease SbcC
MIPVSLTMENFLSYRGEVQIDFSRVNVACISGPNGAGKSSIFDAITWVLFGKARRNEDDALISLGAENCSVTFEMDYESSRYRIQRSRERGKNTSLELHVRAQNDEWKPMTESGVRATEARIREILHLDYDTFINTSFFLQGKADMFAQQTPAHRKEILSSILGLEIWEAYREEAYRRRRAGDTEQYARQNLLNEILAELEGEQDLTERLELLQSSLLKTEELRGQKETLWNQAQTQVRQLKSDEEKLALVVKQLEANRARAASQREQIGARGAELAAYEGTLENEASIRQAYQTWQDTRAEVERWNKLAEQYHQLQNERGLAAAQLQAEEARLNQELAGLEASQKEVDELLPKIPPLQEQVQKDQARLTELEKVLDELPRIDARIADMQKESTALGAENLHLKENMAELKANIEQLEAASESQCPLCGQELSDAHRRAILEQLKAQGKTLGDQYRENNRLIKENDAKQQALKDRLAELRRAQSEMSALQGQAGRNEQMLAGFQQQVDKWERQDQPRLAEVQSVLNEASFSAPQRVQLQQADASLQKLGYQPEEHKRRQQAELEARSAEEDFRNLEKARTAVESLRREIETLTTAAAALDEEIAHSQQQLTELESQISAQKAQLPDAQSMESELEELRHDENSLRQQVGAAQQMVAVLDKQRARKVELTREIAELKKQIAHLKTLETAFGRDGIQALLIEQALPEIELQANDILDRLTSGRMSVTFMTEREYKDKKRDDKKQTLDILISDSSGQREYELFSGGEAFRINFAIRLALARVLAQRAGARLQTLVIDEGFGSQDEEGRQRLIEAINLVGEDFAKILVITHLDELKDAFPSRIEVQKTLGGSMVEVIP